MFFVIMGNIVRIILFNFFVIIIFWFFRIRIWIWWFKSNSWWISYWENCRIRFCVVIGSLWIFFLIIYINYWEFVFFYFFLYVIIICLVVSFLCWLIILFCIRLYFIDVIFYLNWFFDVCIVFKMKGVKAFFVVSWTGLVFFRISCRIMRLVCLWSLERVFLMVFIFVFSNDIIFKYDIFVRVVVIISLRFGVGVKFKFGLDFIIIGRRVWCLIRLFILFIIYCIVLIIIFYLY